MSPTFLLEYWWMGQKAEEQKVSTVKTSTSIRDMTGKLGEEIDIKMGLCLSSFEVGKIINCKKPTLWFCGWVVLKTKEN